MTRDSNYPQDIRNYDNHPQSPFYEDPNEWMEDFCSNLADEWYDEYMLNGRVEFLDWDVDDVTILLFTTKEKTVRDVIATAAYREVEARPEYFKPEPDYSSIEWD